MKEKVFKVKWKDDLGRDWMNKFNLELCLTSAEHTRKELIEVEEITPTQKIEPLEHLTESITHPKNTEGLVKTFIRLITRNGDKINEIIQKMNGEK